MTPPLSDHFNGKTFSNANPRAPGPAGPLALLKWKFTSRAAPWPRAVEFTPQPRPTPRGEEIVGTWIGHATWLLQSAHGNFLIDPQFSPCAGPRGRFGPLRVHPPGVAWENLPRIDVVLLSHDHYDHCDLPSLRRLAAKFDPLFIAPLRHKDLLREAGATCAVELDWWQTHELAAGARVALTPTQHWSNRFGTPRNHRLWGGFFLTLGARRVWFVGDTGHDANLFREIGCRCGAPDLALVPIGAYEPRWFMRGVHINPAEAVELHQVVAARRSVAMHWGTFQLSDEGRDAPLAALVAARTAAGIGAEEFSAIPPGASVTV